MKTERRHREKEKDRERERGRERRRRGRRNSSDNDNYDDDEGGISGWKLGLVIGVIVVCFAMLYPTLLHPMLMGLLGRGHDPKPVTGQQRPPVHPAMGGGGGARHPGAGGHPSRPDMHPAMRMAQAQAEGQGGGTKGMFTWMLPVYTVGVVVFLLYTLFKTKSKGGKKKRRTRDTLFDGSESDLSDSEVDTRYGAKFGKNKLRGLQERLKQTEDAMSKILEQLEAVQNSGQGVDLDAAEQIKEELEGELDEEALEKKKLAVGLNEKNEEYINDLEKALREFQVLSKEYDKASLKKYKSRRASTSDEENSESNSDSEDSENSEADEEEDEEEEEEVTPPPKKSKKGANKKENNKQKVTKKKKQQKKQKETKKKSTSEEEDEEEEELENQKNKEESEEEEEGIDIDTELREQEEKEELAKKSTVRRRKPKKT